MGLGFLNKKTVAENELHNTVKSSVKVMMENAASCITTVSGSNIISIVGSTNVDISQIKQKTWIKVNTSCMVTQTNNVDIKQEIETQFKQSATTMSETLGLNSVESKNLTDNMVELSSEVNSKAVALFQTGTSAMNSISVIDSAGVRMSLVDQESYIDQISTATFDQVMSTTAGQGVKVIVDQAAKATSLNLTLIVGIVTAGVVASVFIIFGSRFLLGAQARIGRGIGAAVASPMLWAGLLAIPALFAISTFVMSLTPNKAMWPLKQVKSTDTADEIAAKRSNNVAVSVISGIVGAACTAGVVGISLYSMKRGKVATASIGPLPPTLPPPPPPPPASLVRRTSGTGLLGGASIPRSSILAALE